MINARTFLPGQTEAPLRDKDKCAERSRDTWPFENRIKKKINVLIIVTDIYTIIELSNVFSLFSQS